MDKLEITALSVATRIGVHEWEQQIQQRLLIDISLSISLSDTEDKLDNTIDYDKLCQMVTTFIESQSFQLIETVAERVIQLIKKDFPVSQVKVRVSKPDAIKNAANISVTLER